MENKVKQIARLIKTVNEKIPDVYAAGVGDAPNEYEEAFGWTLYKALTLYDEVQEKEIRTNYSDAFSRTNFEAYPIRWPKAFVPTGNIVRMFSYYYGQYVLPLVDLSRVPENANCQALFSNSKLKRIPYLGLNAMNSYYQVYENCEDLETIELMHSHYETLFNNTFTKCISLKNITFSSTSEIAKNINFSSCGQLTIESIINIFTTLAKFPQTSSTKPEIKLHKDVLNILTNNYPTILAIATSKNWTVTA